MDFIPDKMEQAVTGAANNVKLTAATASEVLEAIGDLINQIRDGQLEIRISISKTSHAENPNR